MRACVHACMHAYVRLVCLGHYSYINAWISKSFNEVFVLEEEKCHLKLFEVG